MVSDHDKARNSVEATLRTNASTIQLQMTKRNASPTSLQSGPRHQSRVSASSTVRTSRTACTQPFRHSPIAIVTPPASGRGRSP